MELTLYRALFLGLVAFVATFALVPFVRKLAIRLDAVDYPSERRVNKKATPRLGGLAMFGGIVAAALAELFVIFIAKDTSVYHSLMVMDINYILVALGITVVCAVGVLDDIFKLSPGLKMLGLSLAGLLIALGGVQLATIANPFGSGLIHFGWLTYPLTVLYLIAFANIINLIDGLDGLAAGIVVIAAFSLFIVAFGKGRTEAALLSIILLGITLAFLRFNHYPASIFMGDSGSLMLGMLVGVISLTGTMRSPTVIVFIVPIVIAGVPLLDTAAAIIRRVRERKPIQEADTNHVHHRLVNKGFSPKISVYIIWGWTTVLAIGGIAISNTHGLLVIVIFAVLLIFSAILLWRIGLFEPALKHHYNPRPLSQNTDSLEGEKSNGVGSEAASCAKQSEQTK